MVDINVHISWWMWWFCAVVALPLPRRLSGAQHLQFPSLFCCLEAGSIWRLSWTAAYSGLLASLTLGSLVAWEADRLSSSPWVSSSSLKLPSVSEGVSVLSSWRKRNFEASKNIDSTFSPDFADASVQYLMLFSRWKRRAYSRDTSRSDSRSALLPTKNTIALAGQCSFTSFSQFPKLSKVFLALIE